jgi:hypothetical protein
MTLQYSRVNDKIAKSIDGDEFLAELHRNLKGQQVLVETFCLVQSAHHPFGDVLESGFGQQFIAHALWSATSTHPDKDRETFVPGDCGAQA